MWFKYFKKEIHSLHLIKEKKNRKNAASTTMQKMKVGKPTNYQKINHVAP